MNRKLQKHLKKAVLALNALEKLLVIENGLAGNKRAMAAYALLLCKRLYLDVEKLIQSSPNPNGVRCPPPAANNAA